jgi:hypothetical protein
MTTALAALLACGCHSSFATEDTTTDTTTDTGTDTSVDTATDTPYDPVTDPTPPPPSGYALHEWGVMVMGPDGPVFHGSGPEFAGPVPAKPIIYLYADEPFDLDLAVHFSSGEPTETWPEAPLEPTLLWSGLHVEPGPCATTPFPSPYEDPWADGFCEACTLSLSVVEEAACITYGGQVASLLFYTGRMPGYESPLVVGSRTFTAVDGTEQVAFDVENRSGRPVGPVWLVYRDTESTCMDPSACPVTAAEIAWYYLDEVDPTETLAFTVPIQRFEAELDESGWPVGPLDLPAEWNDLGGDVHAALEAEGLTAAEADAFMNAWDPVFFGLMGDDAIYIEPLYANGSSAITFMSREDYDALLPLETSSPAEEIVRVAMIYDTI